jgi:hypothetical protein
MDQDRVISLLEDIRELQRQQVLVEVAAILLTLFATVLILLRYVLRHYS